jgi:hypothetical protein
LGAGEATVAFKSDLAAAKEIGHCRHGFLCVFRAGANGKDEVTQGEFLTRLENLIGLFHKGCPNLSNMGATAQLH